MGRAKASDRVGEGNRVGGIQGRGEGVRASKTEDIIDALRVLASSIESEDGVANIVCSEAANRLEQLESYIMRLTEAGDALWRFTEQDTNRSREWSRVKGSRP